MDKNIIIYLACICFLFIFGRIFIVPLKKIFKLVFNSILGGISILAINLIGANFGFHIGLNIFTSVLIRFTWFARSCVFNNCKIINDLIIKYFNVGKKRTLKCSPLFSYSTVTDLARFLGLSTSNPFSFEM